MAKARDLAGLRATPAPVPAPDEWFPPAFGASCANCYWNWLDVAPGVVERRAVCHLMPRQCLLTNQNQLAAASPGIAKPEDELCSAWKPRQSPEDAPAPGGSDNG